MPSFENEMRERDFVMGTPEGKRYLELVERWRNTLKREPPVVICGEMMRRTGVYEAHPEAKSWIDRGGVLPLP